MGPMTMGQNLWIQDPWAQGASCPSNGPMGTEPMGYGTSPQNMFLVSYGALGGLYWASPGSLLLGELLDTSCGAIRAAIRALGHTILGKQNSIQKV